MRPATHFEMDREAVTPAASWSPLIPSSEVIFGGSLCSWGDADALFMAQGDHRIDAHRPPRGEETRRESNDAKKQCNDHKR